MGTPRIGSDLSWYWTWSEGEMSPPSNFMAMANAMSLGRSQASYPNTEMDEGRLKASTRARLVSRTLERVCEQDRCVLFVAFGPFARKLPVLGDAGPVAALSRTAAAAFRDSHTSRTFGDWLVRLCWRVSKRQGEKFIEDSATLHAITDEAKAMLAKAEVAYRDAEGNNRQKAVATNI